MVILILVLAFTSSYQNLPPVLQTLSFTISFAWAIWFFLFVVILVPFRSSPEFLPNGQRLALDTLLSGLNWITVCGFHYLLTGISPPDKVSGVYDHFYFSTVTFSTLGYGDFSPTPAARPIASIEAIVGNLHLGVLVAAAFLVAGNIARPSADKEGDDSSNEH